MIAVIFEVRIKPGKQGEYLQLAGELREHLAGIKGFLSVERFSSLTEEGKLCSLSFWEDEAAVAAWRQFEFHRFAQAKGRKEIFADYRIRVAEVLRDYGMYERAAAPKGEG